MEKTPYPRAAALKWSFGPAAVIAGLLLISTSAAQLIGVAVAAVSALMIVFPQTYRGTWRRRYHAIGAVLAVAALLVATNRSMNDQPAPIAALAPGDQGAEMRAASAVYEKERAARAAEKAAETATAAAVEAAKEARAAQEKRAAEDRRLACGGAGDGAAAYEAKEAVRARLKNPRGAKFSPLWETTIMATAACERTVIGWVDATNGFGAVIRSRWGVDLAADGRGNWRVEGVLIE